ncbi:MFS transporter [Verticiella sediminum]|uniref:MFS transporter n=1 Tax=Verticiella sediminum TaxID=1247510 RepID=A0A556AFE3_9BURK|nr:MFS transporter [Verticiella sediminum]TSH91599.1 MFS transporter [Verticiella sediminum]
MSDPASSSATPPALGLPAPRRYWAVAVQLIGIIVAVLDNSIVNVALPTIAAGLDASPAEAVRLTNVYNLTLLVMLLPLAALGERIGFRRVFGAGLVLFAFGALACALSRSIEMLTVARVVQGLASAALMSMMGGLMRHIYPPAKFGRGIGLNAMVVALSGAMGPTMSSLILSVADWPWLFGVTIPFALVALAGVRQLPESRRNPGRLDWFGALHSACVLVLIVLGIERLPVAPWPSVGMIALGVVLAVWLVRRSAQQTAPLVPVDLFRFSAFSYAVSASLCLFGAQMAAFVALPFYFQAAFGRDQIAVGFLMTAWPIAGGIMAPIAGRLADRFSAALLSGIGACGMTCGMLTLAALPADSGNGWLLFGLALGGVGFGFFQSPNNRAMLTAVPVMRAGAAGGVQATTRTFGQSLGIALVGIALALGGAQGATLAVVLSAVMSSAAVAVNMVRVRAERRAAG